MAEPKSLLLKLTFGGCSAALAKIISTPVNNVKLILQLSKAGYLPTVHYDSSWEVFLYIYRKRGFWGLWKTYIIDTLRFLPTQFFNSVFKLSFQLVWAVKQQSFFRSQMIGILAGTCSSFLVFPCEMVCTKLISDFDDEYDGAIDVFQKSRLKNPTWYGIYAGFWTSVVGTILGRFFERGLYFRGYNLLSHILLDPNQPVSIPAKWLIAFVNTTLFQILTYPIDTIRRVQMLSGQRSLEVISTIYSTKGIHGFYGGFVFNQFKAAVNALCLASMDYLKDLLVNPAYKNMRSR